MSRTTITVTIITFNEENHLPRALESVSWADEVIVVDSGSTDRTLEIAQAKGAKVFTNAWKGYGQQKNFAHQKASKDWILNLDADEQVSPELKAEILSLLHKDATTPLPSAGFQIPRKSWYLGRWILHGGWYPNYLTRLCRRTQGRWTEPVVHEALQLQGPGGRLHAPLLHFPFADLEDQVRTNLRYSRQGYEELLRQQKPITLLHLLFKPLGKFLETYLLKKGFLDGIAGFLISINAAHSLFLKYAYGFEAKCQRPAPNGSRSS